MDSRGGGQSSPSWRQETLTELEHQHSEGARNDGLRRFFDRFILAVLNNLYNSDIISATFTILTIYQLSFELHCLLARFFAVQDDVFFNPNPF